MSAPQPGDRIVDRSGRQVGIVSATDPVAGENLRKILTATGGRVVPAQRPPAWADRRAA